MSFDLIGRSPIADLVGVDSRYASRLSKEHRIELILYSALVLLAALIAGFSGATVGWIAYGGLPAAILFGLAIGLIVLNLHRLGFVGATLAIQSGVEAAENWRPSITMGVVTAALGGVAVQIPLAWMLMSINAEELDAQRIAMIEIYTEELATAFASRVERLDASLADLSGFTGDKTSELELVTGYTDEFARQRLIVFQTERKSFLVEGENSVFRDRRDYAQQVASLPLVGLRVQTAWTHPFFMFSLTLLAMYLTGAPGFLRHLRPGAMRAYTRERLLDEQSRISADYDAISSLAASALARWPTYSSRETISSLAVEVGSSGVSADDGLTLLDLAVARALGAVLSEGSRNLRWSLVRALLVRYAAGGESDPNRGVIEDWTICELLTLREGGSSIFAGELATELLDAPLCVSMLYDCSRCGHEAQPYDLKCSMCDGALGVRITLE